MKFLFLVSTSPGHIDFGGLGFTNLAAHLSANGHELLWSTYGKQVDALVGHGFSVERFPHADLLKLNAVLTNAFNGGGTRNVILSVVVALQKLIEKLEGMNPDFVCLDRNLPLAQLALDHLNIPYAAVGTPGGYWVRRGGAFVTSSDAPIQNYRDIGHYLSDRLRLTKTSIGSCWANSPFINITFLGHRLYPVNIEAARQCSVNCFTSNRSGRREIRVGMSFGNTGEKIDEMVTLLSYLVERGIVVEVFLPNHRLDVKTALESRCKSGSVRIHGWTDFFKVTEKFSSFIFFGGIGTLWHCMNACTPAVIMVGGRGDQIVNGRIVEAERIGVSIEQGFDIRRDGEALLKRLTDSSWIETCQSNIERLRQSNQFTDSWESLCLRLEKLARS